MKARSLPTDATLFANNSQHCWKLHVVPVSTSCCLYVVACCWDLYCAETSQTFSPMQMDATLLADNSQYCWELLRPFTHSSKCQLWCYKGLHTAMFRRTLYAKAEGIIPWNWLFRTESKGHPSFSKESFWHKTHCFSQIWHNFVDTISFFIFFSLFAQLSTFILNIKMKNK